MLQICIQNVPVFVCEEVRWGSTECPLNQVPEHHSRGGTLTAYEACICQEFSVLLSPAVQLNLFHRRVSKCAPPACRQTSDFLTVILDPQRSCVLKYWHFLFKCCLSFLTASVECSHKPHLSVIAVYLLFIKSQGHLHSCYEVLKILI